MTPLRRFPFGHPPRAVTARAPADVTAPLPAVEPTRRLLGRHETAPAPIESPPPVVERLTMPMDDSAQRRPALPFQHVADRADLRYRDRGGADAPCRDGLQALPREAPERPTPAASVWRRRARIAFILLGLLLYVVAISIIVAPISWGP